MIYKQANGYEYKFAEDDVVADDFIPHGEFNPHNIHPFILADAGFVVAVVFASHLQDALDIAVDNNKLDRFQVTEEELKDYETGECSPEGYPEYSGIAHLGNASEPFDIESLDCVEVTTEWWTRDLWTASQLISEVERAFDLLSIDHNGRCGRTDKGIVDECSRLQQSLLELNKRTAQDEVAR